MLNKKVVTLFDTSPKKDPELQKNFLRNRFRYYFIAKEKGKWSKGPTTLNGSTATNATSVTTHFVLFLFKYLDWLRSLSPLFGLKTVWRLGGRTGQWGRTRLGGPFRLLELWLPRLIRRVSPACPPCLQHVDPLQTGQIAHRAVPESGAGRRRGKWVQRFDWRRLEDNKVGQLILSIWRIHLEYICNAQEPVRCTWPSPTTV